MISDPLIFTVDVEEYFHAENILNSLKPNKLNGLPRRASIGIKKILETLHEHKSNATFFVLGEVAEQNRGLIREIAGEGHEIASHGYRHIPLYKLGAKDFLDDLKRSVGILEEITGQRCLGYRATSYSLSGDMPWFFDVLHKCHIVYDSSVSLSWFRTHWREAAMRGKPFEIHPGIMEFPVAFGSFGPLRFPLGGGYFRAYPYGWTRGALRSLQKNDGLPVFYIHNWELDPEQPRLSISYVKSVRHYLNLSQSQKKLRWLLQDFKTVSIQESPGMKNFFNDKGKE